ncbi:hypothetical protein N7450_011493 [Penicillium hetheringtonii]|uniref:RNase H type-1 domain-containing protein n=1 Tax=Penicillium hetheringtonii TaxID=911720 RepID=A0AAD6DA18_9EURO|nr:hypothetical protein N7450_011493 [Penicillium hetheringtonii]
MVQRIACQAIVGSFKTVALHIAEAEAGIEPVLVRLRKRVLKHWVKCHTLPRSHPFWACRDGVASQKRDHLSPFKLLALLCPEPTSSMEIIGPVTEEPDPSLNSKGPHIITEPVDDVNLQGTTTRARLWIFTYSVARNGRIGSGLLLCVRNRTMLTCSGLAGDLESTNVHLSSLIAIHDSLSYVQELLSQIQMEPSRIEAMICTNDLASLQSLDHPTRQHSGQQIRLATMHQARGLINQGLQIQFRWTPNKSTNDLVCQAKALALKATETCDLQCVPTQTAPAIWRQVVGKLDMRAKEEFESMRGGRWSRNLDAALPGKHTNFLYDNLSRRQAALLIQLRTGHARLNRYLQRMGHLENNTCGCGTDSDDGETVEHFLFHCPDWNQLRQEMKLRMGSRYGDTSYALGGRSRKVDLDGHPVDEAQSWKPNLSVVREVLRFVENTGRLDREIRT